MTYLNEAFYCYEKLGLLGACWFSIFTKLFSKKVKVTFLWWNLDNSSDLKLLKLKFLYSRYTKTLDSSFSNVAFIINEIKWSWSLRLVSVKEVCLKEYLLLVNIRSIQEPLPLKQVISFHEINEIFIIHKRQHNWMWYV